jgi:predicted NUDIX family NTP pyrophosphohydrolase
VQDGEELLAAAIREFTEEIGMTPDVSRPISLGQTEVKNNKVIHAWGIEYNFGKAFTLQSNLIEIQWPPRTGNVLHIPEIDQAQYFDVASAFEKVSATQKVLIERLLIQIKARKNQ